VPYRNAFGLLLLPETTEGLSEHVRGADVLVTETTFLDRDAAIARGYRQRGHKWSFGHLVCACRRRWTDHLDSPLVDDARVLWNWSAPALVSV
jgi:hypothetical protein